MPERLGADMRRTWPPLLKQGWVGAGGTDVAVPPRPGRSCASPGAAAPPTRVCSGDLRGRLPRPSAALNSTACVWVAVLLHGSMRAGGGGVQALTVRPPGWSRGAGLRGAQRLRGRGAGLCGPELPRLCMVGREADHDEDEPIFQKSASKSAGLRAAARRVWADGWTRAVKSISNKASRVEDRIMAWQQGGLRKSRRAARGGDSKSVRDTLGLDFSPENGDVADFAWSGDTRDAVNAVGTVTLSRDAGPPGSGSPAPASSATAAAASASPWSTNSNDSSASSPTSSAMSLATSAYTASLYAFTDDGRRLSAISRYADDYWISNLLTLMRSRVFQRIFSRCFCVCPSASAVCALLLYIST